jgi:hypothetical protein
MKVKLTHIEQGFRDWYMNEVASINLWLALATPVVMLSVANLEKKHGTFIASLLDENGEVDIDELHKEYKKIFDQKQHIQISGLKVNSQDLDKLVEYIKKNVPPKVGG